MPSSLRRHANDQRELRIEADSIKDAVDRLLQKHPGLKTIIHDLALLSIFINSKLVRAGADSWDKISLSSDDVISLIVPIAGG
ncbi:MAG: MoaD/ThiS family protein [Planctomycetota bacterium]